MSAKIIVFIWIFRCRLGTFVPKACVADCATTKYLDTDNLLQRKLLKMIKSV